MADASCRTNRSRLYPVDAFIKRCDESSRCSLQNDENCIKMTNNLE